MISVMVFIITTICIMGLSCFMLGGNTERELEENPFNGYN